MKPVIKSGLVLAIVLFALPSSAITMPVTLPVEVTNQIETIRLTNRLEEIKAMDKSTLTSKEKRALRDEVKEIKKKNASGGVFLSIGGIIIIILLLILLL